MVDFELTAEQQDRAVEFSSFAAERVTPRAPDFDRAEAIPAALIRELAERGYLASQVSSEFGGRGLDPISYGLLHEELGKGCSSVRSLLTVHDMVAEALIRVGTGKQKEAWLPRLAQGELIGAFALTEPAAGSDASAIKTSADQVGDEYVLSGCKKWISFGQVADAILVIARVGEAGGQAGFLVPRDAPGLSITPMKGLLGLRAAMLAEIELHGCRIPSENRLGSANLPSGFTSAAALHLGRYSVAWGCVAIGTACLEASFRYAAEREQFDLPLQEHQLIRRMLSDMVIDVRAARLLCLEAGQLIHSRGPRSIQATLIAKYFASRMANRVAADAVQIHGALGTSDSRPLERHFRDAKIMEIIEGSSQVMQLMIAKHAAGEYRPLPERTEG